MQTDCPGPLTDPSSHGTQDDDPLSALYIPASQRAHSLAPDMELYDPAGQGEQLDDPVVLLLYIPGGQTAHSSFALPVLYVPAEQERHEEESVVSLSV